MLEDFRKLLWVSAGIHVLVFLFCYFAPSFHLPRKDTKITMIKLAKGTGESTSPLKKAKGMPESTVREQKNVKEVTKDKKGADLKSKKSEVKKKAETPKPKASPKGGINPTPKKKTVEDKTIEDALAKVQEQLQQREVPLEAAQIEKEGTGQSMNGSLEEGTTLDPALIAYYNELKRRINEQWITLPKEGEAQALKTTITVVIDGGGNLVSTSYESKSGDAAFDLSAMRAVERAAPFPVPPDAIKQEAVREGFLIEFNPRSVVGGV